ncbi:hypothetical protein ACJX0J_025866, partial [Zea mays]
HTQIHLKHKHNLIDSLEHPEKTAMQSCTLSVYFYAIIFIIDSIIFMPILILTKIKLYTQNLDDKIQNKSLIFLYYPKSEKICIRVINHTQPLPQTNILTNYLEKVPDGIEEKRMTSKATEGSTYHLSPSKATEGSTYHFFYLDAVIEAGLSETKAYLKHMYKHDPRCNALHLVYALIENFWFAILSQHEINQLEFVSATVL